jgi:MinD superfamily P-loop ATPase
LLDIVEGPHSNDFIMVNRSSKKKKFLKNFDFCQGTKIELLGFVVFVRTIDKSYLQQNAVTR